MTATERAKRSDALYYETVSVTRRVLCDMIANRESDIDDLRNLVRDALACVRESSRGSRRTRRRTATYGAAPRIWGWTSENNHLLGRTA